MYDAIVLGLGAVGSQALRGLALPWRAKGRAVAFSAWKATNSRIPSDPRTARRGSIGAPTLSTLATYSGVKSRCESFTRWSASTRLVLSSRVELS
jgi:hypothetical protein